MHHALPFSRPLRGQGDLAAAIRSLPTSAASCLMAVAVLCAFFAVVTPAMGSAEPASGPSLPQVLPEAAPAQVRAKFRCETCGVVEALHRKEAVGDQPASHEFTVRLRDGSSRTSSVENAGNWHIGDQVMLIGGSSQSH